MSKYGYPTAFNLQNTIVVSVGGSSTQSSALSNNMNYYRLVSTVDTLVEMGENPTADSNSMLLPAFTIEYVTAPVGSKIAVKQHGSQSGSFYITHGIR